jgi:hypothetical protein
MNVEIAQFLFCEFLFRSFGIIFAVHGKGYEAEHFALRV